MNKKTRDQIMKVRDTALTELGYYELVTFITEHPDEYSNFILTGEE